MRERERRPSETSVSKDDVAAQNNGYPDETVPARTWRFKRSGQPKPPGAETRLDSIPPELAELVLLREENAWLKAAQHQAPGVGQVIERVRALPAAQPDAEDLEDEATQILVEVHVLRESLLELCGEIQQAMARVQATLEALSSGFVAEPPTLYAVDEGGGRPEAPMNSREGNFSAKAPCPR